MAAGEGGRLPVNEPARCEAALSPILDGHLPTDSGLDQPTTGVAADFDGDERLDLALLANYDQVALVLGNGDGTLRPGVTYRTGLPLAMDGNFAAGLLAVGDMNGDGRLDLVAASEEARGVAVFLGQGGGVLAPSIVCALDGIPLGVVTRDFDGDGGDELAVSLVADESFNVRVLRGDDSCATLWSSESMGYGGPLDAADVDVDGKLDLVASGDGLHVFLGDGTGAFVAGNHYDGRRGAESVLLRDFDHDGALDVAVTLACTRRDPSSVLVRLGHGDGTFGDETEYATGICAASGAAVDTNGNATLDLVLSPGLTLPGNGDGTFGPLSAGPEALGGHLVGVGDFDADGLPDVAAAADEDVVVRRGNGDGTFGVAPLFETDLTPASLTLADLDGDGKLDLATSNTGANYWELESVSVRLGTGDGSFAPRVDYPVARSPSTLAAADVNSDGLPDLLVTSAGAGAVRLLLQTSDAHFASENELGFPASPDAFALSDVNGDGKPDVLSASASSPATLSVLLGAGDGSFLAEPERPIPEPTSALLLFDANGDQVPDLAGGSNETDLVWVALGRGDGTFASAHETAASTVVAMAAGDLNGDGAGDLVVSEWDSLTVLLGAGDGSFDERTRYALGGTDVTLSDLDGDGALDVVLSRQGIVVLKGTGDGTFECFQTYAIGGPTGEIRAGDLDADGRSDVVALTRTGASVLMSAAR